MKIVGVTQGSNLKVFLRLADMLQKQFSIDGVAAFVADSMVFNSLASTEPSLLGGSIVLLKEWEIVSKGKKRTPDWERLAKYERKIGDPVLWNALIADRRIFFGRRCKMRQDYRPRFSYKEMGGILETGLEKIESFIDRFKPDLVIGFGTSTIGDYLFYIFAKGRCIPYLQLKATKIGNRISLNDDAVKLSKHVETPFHGNLPIPDWALDYARRYLEGVRKRGVQYEGAILRRRKYKFSDSLIALARGFAVDIKRHLDPITRKDNHVESIFLTYLYERFRNPLNRVWIDRQLGREIICRGKLKDYQPFAFFPLHFEPEVSLQVFGRAYQNQIELIRTLATNLPAGMHLLVKEHPRAQGFRPLNFYKKLLEIPNVRLVDTMLPTHAVVSYAELVTVISGSTGLEAAICKKPVMTFGTPVYNVLNGNMIRHVSVINKLGLEIRNLLENYRYEESKMERYIAATVAGSVPVDLYTALLEKPGRVYEGRENMSKEQRRQQDYDLLANYCGQRIDEVLSEKNKVE